MLRWLDRLPVASLAVAAAILGLSPSLSEPHLLRQLRLVSAGDFEAVDVLDLAMHASLPLLLVLKLLRSRRLDRLGRK
jgi:hypothetical protein